jgi:hypothetical protein
LYIIINMKIFKVIKGSSVVILFAMMITIFLPSCEKFLNPDQELNIREDQLYGDWYEYRSTEMGLYGLQQKLVEQLLILGELRADLLTITPNADVDMVEIYNFNVSQKNKYASPLNFFKLISASNNFIRILEREHPEVLDPESPVTNYDKLYGEAICMRAWAYFNAARIYGKVPYIYESLVTLDEIVNYVNSPGTYIDSVYIDFNRDGYYNDTIYNYPITLEKQMYDLDLVLDVFTKQLETKIKAVGVNHYINNNDITWEVTIWNTWALHALLGQMYLTQGNYTKAVQHFDQIVKNETDNYRYEIDNSFAMGMWRNIFTNIDGREHIFTIWFDKAYFQQNQFQSWFEPWAPHNYMLKPTRFAITNWETVWRGQSINEDLSNPSRSRMAFPGIPSDFYRGYGTSYVYLRNGIALSGEEYMRMLDLKSKDDIRSVNAIMAEVDTIVYKYSINKGRFDQDANFILYRAAGIHLYLAETYTWWEWPRGGEVKAYVSVAVDLLNDGGAYYYGITPRPQVGIRGRVGLSNGMDGINVTNIVYIHNPFTNEIIGYQDLSGDFLAKQLHLEEQILDERARELAYEGERFYDLIRVAKRRNDPSFLASKVAAKYPADQRDRIYNLLLDERNWYINYFE